MIMRLPTSRGREGRGEIEDTRDAAPGPRGIVLAVLHRPVIAPGQYGPTIMFPEATATAFAAARPTFDLDHDTLLTLAPDGTPQKRAPARGLLS
jgi:hypothetical protein